MTIIIALDLILVNFNFFVIVNILYKFIYQVASLQESWLGMPLRRLRKEPIFEIKSSFKVFITNLGLFNFVIVV